MFFVTRRAEQLKESGKYIRQRRKKLLRGLFLVIICITCGIMYVNRHSPDTVIDVSEPAVEAETEADITPSPQMTDARDIGPPANEADAGVQPEATADAQPEATETGVPREDAAAEDDGRVDINRAGVAELMTLNGIGEKKAMSIVEFRTKNGLFASIEDIMKVPGIKEGTFSKIRDMIKV